MRDTREMRQVRLGVLIAAAMVGVVQSASAAPVNESLAPGWQAFYGCWEPVTAPAGTLPPGTLPDTTAAHLVCVVPVEGSGAVDMVTVVNGQVVERERVDATGTASPTRKDDCAGTRSATWSTVGQRLYVRSELVCDGGLRRTATGVISMTSMHEWMDVQSVAVGGQKAVRVLRYRAVGSSAAVPAEVSAALGSRPFSVSAARLAATAPVTTADIIDVSRHLDEAGAEVWLLEQRLAFTADSRRLVELTKAGVPGGVVDVVVALSYPERFAIDLNRREIELRPGEARLGGSSMSPGYGGYGGWDPMWDPYYGSRYGRRYYSPYGYSQYGYGYGYGWYPGTRPVVIVVNPPPAGEVREGRVVKGSGYTRTRPANSDPTPDRRAGSDPRSGGSSSGGDASSGGSSSGGSSGGGSSSGGSSGGSTGRTAKVRPPGN